MKQMRPFVDERAGIVIDEVNEAFAKAVAAETGKTFVDEISEVFAVTIVGSVAITVTDKGDVDITEPITGGGKDCCSCLIGRLTG